MVFGRVLPAEDLLGDGEQSIKDGGDLSWQRAALLLQLRQNLHAEREDALQIRFLRKNREKSCCEYSMATSTADWDLLMAFEISAVCLIGALLNELWVWSTGDR